MNDTAHNTPKNDAPSVDMAMVNLRGRTVIVAQARFLLIEKVSGRACVVGRRVSCNCCERLVGRYGKVVVPIKRSSGQIVSHPLNRRRSLNQVKGDKRCYERFFSFPVSSLH
jgi:hypothetical protein